MTGTPEQQTRWYQSLRFRLVGMMSLALLPIGLIAISQTYSVSEKAEENAELALLVLTERAALQQRLFIQRAVGAGEVLTRMLPELSNDPETCSRVVSDFVAEDDSFSFAAYIPRSGVTTCSSNGREFDFSEFPAFQKNLAAGRLNVTINTDAPMSGTSVMIVSRPVFGRLGDVMGIFTISIPHFAMSTEALGASDSGLIDLITFNRGGEVLTSTRDLNSAVYRLPRNVGLDSLVGEPAQSFSGRDRSGASSSFAVVPIDEDAIYVLGIWDSDSQLADQLKWRLPASLFPGMMWLASLGVGLFAIHRLVTRHVQRLGVQMGDFARSRKLPDTADPQGVPTEVQRIQSAFQMMAESILRDEAELEDSVRGKNALIKEVHHRVKNNLQLISSMINMQIRELDDPESKKVLRRIQDRVLSLATIHRDLYQTTTTGGQVNVGHLLREIVTNTIEMATADHDSLKLDTDIEPIQLYPDQAVPMSLLAAEAATNAMKYFGTKGDAEPWIRVSFRERGDNICEFVFSNSVGEDKDVDGTGMGALLIKAFAIQLGAEIDVEKTDELYMMSVTFKAEEFAPEAGEF